MALKTHSLDALGAFLPANTLDDVIQYMHAYKIHLIVRKDRKHILGDYRPAHQQKPHTISINSSLNPYHFLITFIHELAHLLTFLQYQQRVSPHGKEWQFQFAQLMKRFTDRSVFPGDLQQALIRSMQRPAASTCSDPALFRVIHRYDHRVAKGQLVESLSPGDRFRTADGTLYEMLTKRRTRYECVQIESGKRYLFPGIYEVQREYYVL